MLGLISKQNIDAAVQNIINNDNANNNATVNYLANSGKHDVLEFVKHVQYSQASGDFDESLVAAGNGLIVKSTAVEREKFTMPANSSGMLIETYITAIGDTRATSYVGSAAGIIFGFVPLDGDNEDDIQITAGTADNNFGTTLKNPVMGTEAITLGFMAGGAGKEWIDTTAFGNGMARMNVGDGQPVYTLWGSKNCLSANNPPNVVNYSASSVLTGQDSYAFRRLFNTNATTANHKFACLGTLGIVNCWSPNNVAMLLSQHPTFIMHHRVFAVFT